MVCTRILIIGRVLKIFRCELQIHGAVRKYMQSCVFLKKKKKKKYRKCNVGKAIHIIKETNAEKQCNHYDDLRICIDTDGVITFCHLMYSVCLLVCSFV